MFCPIICNINVVLESGTHLKWFFWVPANSLLFVILSYTVLNLYRTYYNIEQYFSLCAMENFNKISHRSLPYVERMLPCWAGTNIFSIPWKAALFPHCLINEILHFLISFYVPEKSKNLVSKCFYSCHSAPCLGMSYYVNFLGGLGSKEFDIKWRFT